MSSRLRLKRENDGSGHLFVAGMLIKVQPAQDGASAALTRLSEDYIAGIDALPMDAHTMLGKKSD